MRQQTLNKKDYVLLILSVVSLAVVFWLIISFVSVRPEQKKIVATQTFTIDAQVIEVRKIAPQNYEIVLHWLPLSESQKTIKLKKVWINKDKFVDPVLSVKRQIKVDEERGILKIQDPPAVSESIQCPEDLDVQVMSLPILVEKVKVDWVLVQTFNRINESVKTKEEWVLSNDNQKSLQALCMLASKQIKEGE